MEFGPIFRALIHSKGRFWLIVVEIALTLAVVVNCLNMIVDLRQMGTRDTGIDERNVLVVVSEPFAPEFSDDAYARADFREDLDTLRALPGVRAATASLSIPLSGSGSSMGRKVTGTDVVFGVPYYVVAPGILETLDLELVAGRAFVEDDFPSAGGDKASEDSDDDDAIRNVILSQHMAETMFPDGDAVGRTIESRSGEVSERIVGIVAELHSAWPTSTRHRRALLYPGEPWTRRATRYLVRAEPGMVDTLYTELEQALLERNDGRILTVETLTEVKRENLKDLMAVNKMLGAVSGLLVAVTCLGIIGLTSFSVTQRTRQIGTRRALGATRLAILRYFLLENWLMTGVGLAFGLAVTYGLNFALFEMASVSRLEPPLVVQGMLLLWIVGLLSALVPALRGATVPPVIATRTI